MRPLKLGDVVINLDHVTHIQNSYTAHKIHFANGDSVDISQEQARAVLRLWIEQNDETQPEAPARQAEG